MSAEAPEKGNEEKLSSTKSTATENPYETPKTAAHQPAQNEAYVIKENNAPVRGCCIGGCLIPFLFFALSLLIFKDKGEVTEVSTLFMWLFLSLVFGFIGLLIGFLVSFIQNRNDNRRWYK